jgi:hypothetical protein
LEPKPRHYSIAYVIAAMIVLFLMQLFLMSPHSENLAYSDFKALLSKGKVSDLSIAQQTITGTLAARSDSSPFCPGKGSRSSNSTGEAGNSFPGAPLDRHAGEVCPAFHHRL